MFPVLGYCFFSFFFSLSLVLCFRFCSFVSCRVRAFRGPSHSAYLINLFGMTCSRFYDQADKAPNCRPPQWKKRNLATQFPPQQRRTTGTIGVKMGGTRIFAYIDPPLSLFLSCAFQSKPTEIKLKGGLEEKDLKRLDTAAISAEELVKLSKRNQINIFKPSLYGGSRRFCCVQ